nr:SMEK domain-containing protein [Mucilaginibacter sp. L294]
MIASGQLFDKINEKIAILRVEIAQSAKRGVLNIHKQCENLMKHLLNKTYGLQLINLNVSVANFPGLDLGDERARIAYQITSDKTSGKVDDMLEKVVRYRHYTKFPAVRLFILGGKQGSYAINTVTAPHFTFDEKTGIEDFDDLLRDIQDLPLAKLLDVYQLLEDELPYMLQQLKGEEIKADLKNKHLISTPDSILQAQLPSFTHSIIRIGLIGHRFSVPTLIQKLHKFYDGFKKNNLHLFNPVYQQPSNAQQVDFYEKLSLGNANNWYKEAAMRITSTHITVEFATYFGGSLELTTLNKEVLAIQTLLIFCKQLYAGKIFQVELDVDLLTNGKLSYMRNNSVLAVSPYQFTPYLDPRTLAFSKVVTDISDETFNEIFSELVHGFVMEGQPGYFLDPFIHLDEAAQNSNNEFYRNQFSLPLKDIED